MVFPDDAVVRFEGWLRNGGSANPEADPQPKSPATIKKFRGCVKRFEAWRAGRVIDPGLMREFKSYLILDCGKANDTVQTEFCACYAWFAFLKAEKLAKNLPRQGCVKMPSRRCGTTPRPTAEQMELLWDAALNRMPKTTAREQYERGRAIIVLAILDYTAQRNQAICGLDVKDFREGADGWEVHFRATKGLDPKVLPWPSHALPLLEEWLKIRGEFCKRHGYTGDALIPVSRTRRLADDGLRFIVKDLKERAGLGDVKFQVHGIRGLVLTETGDAYGAGVAQNQAGHATQKTTLDHYLRSDRRKTREAAENRRKDRQEQLAGKTPGPTQQGQLQPVSCPCCAALCSPVLDACWQCKHPFRAASPREIGGTSASPVAPAVRDTLGRNGRSGAAAWN